MVFRYAIAAALLVGSIAVAQVPATQELPANDLVRQVVDHELSSQDSSLWKYRFETEQSGAVEVADVVETKSGDLRRAFSRNGQPLTAEQRKAEDQATARFMASPEEQQKQLRAIAEDTHKTMDLLALLPKALTFDYAGQNGDTITLNFRPNPDFHPPSREARVFHEMEGQLILDRKQNRVVEFTGHLAHEVRFGILGHLGQGGTFDVRQEEVAPGRWEITRLKINMEGKAVFFKTINVQQNEVRSGFQQVPDTITLPQAADLLRK